MGDGIERERERERERGGGGYWRKQNPEQTTSKLSYGNE